MSSSAWPWPSGPAARGLSPGVRARLAAAQALWRVHQHRAYLNLALRAVRSHWQLTAEESAAATALAAGVLRWRMRLDWALRRLSRRPLQELDPPLLEILRLGAFEVGFAPSTPAPVAVDLAVRAAGTLHPGAAAFANGVLRSLVRRWGRVLPEPDQGPADERLAIAFSHPRWLVRRWLGHLGGELTRRLLEANNHSVPVTVRVNLLRTTPGELQQRWRQEGLVAQPAPLWPQRLLLVQQAGRAVDQWPGFREGHFTPQSEAAAMPGRLLDPRSGQRVVDLAAAPGGKTTQLAEQAEDGLQLVAVDRHPGRARLVQANARRLGLSCVRVVAADAAAAPLPQGWADAVLLDAPCSDLGTLARRPEVRYRRTPQDLARLVQLQRALLDSAVALLRPGGRLVYSVCSLEPEETVEQVAWLLARWPALELEEAPPWWPQVEAWPWQGHGLWILPHLHRTDGFFVASFRLSGRPVQAGFRPGGQNGALVPGPRETDRPHPA